jgi:hypothetical protein
MSIVLDALRRGRSRHNPEPVHPSRTNAVLQTLGRRRMSDRTPLARVVVWLAVALLAVGILAAILLLPTRI